MISPFDIFSSAAAEFKSVCPNLFAQERVALNAKSTVAGPKLTKNSYCSVRHPSAFFKSRIHALREWPEEKLRALGIILHSEVPGPVIPGAGSARWSIGVPTPGF